MRLIESDIFSATLSMCTGSWIRGESVLKYILISCFDCLNSPGTLASFVTLCKFGGIKPHSNHWLLNSFCSVFSETVFRDT